MQRDRNQHISFPQKIPHLRVSKKHLGQIIRHLPGTVIFGGMNQFPQRRLEMTEGHDAIKSFYRFGGAEWAVRAGVRQRFGAILASRPRDHDLALGGAMNAKRLSTGAVLAAVDARTCAAEIDRCLQKASHESHRAHAGNFRMRRPMLQRFR